MDDLSLALNNSGIGGYLGNAFLVTHITNSLMATASHCTSSSRRDKT